MFLTTLPASQFPCLLLSQANRAFIAAMAVILEHVVDAIAEYTESLPRPQLLITLDVSQCTLVP